MGASVLFDIAKRDVFVDGSKVPHRVAIINKNTGQVIGIVGDNYSPILNTDLLEQCIAILDKSKMPFNVSEAHLIRGGSKTVIEIDILGEQMLVNNDDPLMLKIYLINSFDGFSSARLIAGFIRLICENGMTIGKKEFALSYRHVGNASDLIVEDFKKYVTNKIKEMSKFVARLKQIAFHDEAQVYRIIDGSGWIPDRYHKNLIMQIQNMQFLNGWDLYNVFTYVITHEIERNIEGRLQFYRKLNEEAVKWEAVSN